MKILFDQGTPAPLRSALTGHEVRTAFECGWSELQNGALLAAAEADGFEVLITTDQNLTYQQNLSQRRIAFLVLTTTSWPRIRVNTGPVTDALERVTSGAFLVVTIP